VGCYFFAPFSLFFSSPSWFPVLSFGESCTSSSKHSPRAFRFSPQAFALTLADTPSSCRSKPRSYAVRTGRKMGSTFTCDSVFEALLENSEEAVTCFLLDGTILLWNSAAERLYGYTQSEIVGKHASLLVPLDELPTFLELFEDPLLVESREAETAWRKKKSDVRVPVHLKRSLIRSQNGQIQGILERASSLSSPLARFSVEAHLRLLVEQLPVSFWTTDQHLRFTSHWGPGFPRRPNAQSSVIGQRVQDYFHCPEDEQTPAKQHLDALRGISSHFELQRRGRTFDLRLEPFRDGQNVIVGCLGLAIDITQRKKSEDQIRYQATHDGLTGLVTYRECFESLERELARAARTKRPFALLLLDLDDLKGINDRLGHLAGNRALRRVARALKQNCRASDLAARFGGDEFALLLIDSDAAMAEQVAARVAACLREQPNPPRLTVGMGLAVCPEDATTAQALFEIADKRLYSNKKSSRLDSLSGAGQPALQRAR
jgi:diguanylate cyclase (GGDEF)-like protein/PAS domain S-box-containing protein